MFTRSAIFEGAIHEGKEEEFFAMVEDRLLPIWRRMPGALNVRVMRPLRSDPGSAPIILVQEVDYPSMEAIDLALESPVRVEGRAVTDDMMKLCNGRFYHLVYQRIS